MRSALRGCRDSLVLCFDQSDGSVRDGRDGDRTDSRLRRLQQGATEEGRGQGLHPLRHVPPHARRWRHSQHARFLMRTALSRCKSVANRRNVLSHRDILQVRE